MTLRPGQVRLDPSAEDVVQDSLDLLWEDMQDPPPLACHILKDLAETGYSVVRTDLLLALFAGACR